MKFKIRKPFSIHIETVVQRTRADGKKFREPKVVSHFADDGDPIELTEEQALAHLHKLAPYDDAAKAFIDKFYADQAAARAHLTPAPQSLHAEIAAAVTAALVSAGVVKAAKSA
jgi:hypothetical protein